MSLRHLKCVPASHAPSTLANCSRTRLVRYLLSRLQFFLDSGLNIRIVSATESAAAREAAVKEAAAMGIAARGGAAKAAEDVSI
jgi:hypothetical protein